MRALKYILPFHLTLSLRSPTWLLSRGRTDDARASLNRLYNKNNIEPRLDALQATLDAETLGEKEGSFIECFKGTNLKRTATVSLLFFGSAGLIGASFLSQNIYFLLTVGLEAVHSFDIGIGGFFLACVAIAIGWFFTDVIGRRTLWLIGVAGNAVGMAVIGALSFDSSRGGLWAIAVLMLVVYLLLIHSLYLFGVRAYLTCHLGMSSSRFKSTPASRPPGLWRLNSHHTAYGNIPNHSAT